MILVNCAPATPQRLLGTPYEPPVGSQTKINIVLRRPPRLRSGIEPAIGFAGTLHLGQGYARLQQVYEGAPSSGRIPDPMPCEIYCHTLTDGSILDPELRAVGYHTLTFVRNAHASEPVRGGSRRYRGSGRRMRRCGPGNRSSPNRLAPRLALDRRGEPCIEVMTPLDIEAELRMPGGHIFHGDLDWPWLADDASGSDPRRAMGRGDRLSRHPDVRLWSSTRWRSAASAATIRLWPYLKATDDRRLSIIGFSPPRYVSQHNRQTSARPRPAGVFRSTGVETTGRQPHFRPRQRLLMLLLVSLRGRPGDGVRGRYGGLGGVSGCGGFRVSVRARERDRQLGGLPSGL